MYLQHKAVICWSLKLLLESNAIENGYMFKLHQTNNISWRLHRRKRSTYYLLHWLIIIERFHSHGQHIRKFFWNKRKRLHKKSVQIPKNLFGTPTWPPFYCFRTPIWPPWRHVKTLYRVFHSRGQHLWKFIGTKESVCIRKELNSHRIGLGHQYGCRDVMWKRSIEVEDENNDEDAYSFSTYSQK